MDTITTRFGAIPVSDVVERYESGALLSCSPTAETVLATPLGPLVPQHSTDDLRRRTVQTLLFHENGMLRHLPLERPTVVATAAGPVSAELVTFYPDGSLHRVFPLNGKLSGHWSQEDEGRLAVPATLDTPLGRVSLRLINACFAENGALLSLTLWPGETLDVPTPVGVLKARVGVSFRPDGTLRSLEPAKPQNVLTPAGVIQAYDLDAVGISGDLNSLGFAPDGSVARIATNLTRVTATGPHGPAATTRIFTPESRESICGDGEVEITPLRLEFTPEALLLRLRPEAEWTVLPRAEYSFRAEPHLPQFAGAFASPFARLKCSC